VLLTIAAVLVSFLLVVLVHLLQENERGYERYLTPSGATQSRSTVPRVDLATSFTPAPTVTVQAPVTVHSTGASTPTGIPSTVPERKVPVGLAIERWGGEQESGGGVQLAVYAGDTLRAGPNTTIEVQFVDGSSVLLEPDSVLRVINLSVEDGVGELYQRVGAVKMLVRSLFAWYLKTNTVTLSSRVENTEVTVVVDDHHVRTTVARGLVVAHGPRKVVVIRAGQLLVAHSDGRMTVGTAATGTVPATPTAVPGLLPLLIFQSKPLNIVGAPYLGGSRK
jgi:hypothetical protein